MHRNVHILGTGIYNPKKAVTNEYFINYFKKYDLDRQIAKLFDRLGRETTYLADDDETNISMSLEAAKRALKDADLTPSDIDMIISASDTPEYLSPSCALMITGELNADNVKSVFDVNNDCLAMLNAIDIAVKYMKTDKKYKRTLVVGSILKSPFTREDDLMIYGTVADGAAAVILEAREENELSGFLGSNLFTDHSYIYTIRFPVCGMSKIYKDDIDIIDKKMKSTPFDFTFISDRWKEIINELLNEYNYNPTHVSHYFMSQFSKEDIVETMDKLGADMSMATFVGDKYGYAGCTSPIMALDYRLKKEKFAKEDLVVFCSAGAGYTAGALLYKW